MNYISNKNLELKGKKVLLRVDLNVPMKNGYVTESSRIEKILPTINLADKFDPIKPAPPTTKIFIYLIVYVSIH